MLSNDFEDLILNYVVEKHWACGNSQPSCFLIAERFLLPCFFAFSYSYLQKMRFSVSHLIVERKYDFLIELVLSINPDFVSLKVVTLRLYFRT